MKISKIIKNVFNLTNSGVEIFYFLIKKKKLWVTTEQIAINFNYDLSTPQRSVKRLFDSGLILRRQINREGGGYNYFYQIRSLNVVKKIICKRIVDQVKMIR